MMNRIFNATSAPVSGNNCEMTDEDEGCCVITAVGTTLEGQEEDRLAVRASNSSEFAVDYAAEVVTSVDVNVMQRAVLNCIADNYNDPVLSGLTFKIGFSHQPAKVKVTTSGLATSELENVYVASKQWNWLITNFDSGSNVTHVIVKQTACNFRVTLRTLKYVMGMASRIWIVSYQWVEDSLAAGSPLPEVNYEVYGCQYDNQQVFNCGPQRARLSSQPLLEGWHINFIGSDTDNTHTASIRRLASLAGACTAVSCASCSPSRTVNIALSYEASASNSTGCLSPVWLFNSISEYHVQDTSPYNIETFNQEPSVQEENLSYLHVRTDNGQTLGKQMVTAKQCSYSQNNQLTNSNIGVKQQATAQAGNDVKQCSNDVNTEGSSNFFQLANLATSFDVSMTTSSTTTTTTITTATSLNSKISEGVPSQHSQNTKNVMLLPIGTENKPTSSKPKSQTITNKPIPPPVPVKNVIVLKLDGSSPSGNCNDRLLPQNISYQSPTGTNSSKVNVNGVLNQPIWIPVQNNNVRSPEGVSSIFLQPVCTVGTISSPPSNNKQVAPLPPPSLGLYCYNNGQQQLPKVLLAKTTTNSSSRPTVVNKNARLPISTSLFEGKRRPVRNTNVRTAAATTIAVHHSDSEDNDDPNDSDYTPESEFAKCSTSNKNKTTGNKSINGNKVDVAIATSTSSHTATTTPCPFPVRPHQEKRRVLQKILAEIGQPSGKSGDIDGGSVNAPEVKTDHSYVVNAPQSSLDDCVVNISEPKTTTRAAGKKRKKQTTDDDSSQQSSDDDDEAEENVARKRVLYQCKFCGKHVTHLLRHLRAIHSSESEIIKLLAMPANSAAYKMLMVQLGKDALTTNEKSVRGRLQRKTLVMLETSDNNKDGHDLGEPSSVVFPKAVLRCRQQRACAAKIKQEVDDTGLGKHTNKETPSKKKSTASSSEPKLISKKHFISDAAVKRVDSVMHGMKHEELIAAVRGDNIALKYCYVACNGSEKHSKMMITHIGRLLLELHKVHKSTLSASSSSSMPPLLLADYIYSKEKFDLVKKAAQNLSNYNEKTGQYTFVSVIDWINRTLKTCASLAEYDAKQLHDTARARAAQIFSASCDENFSKRSQNQQAQSSKDSAKPTKPIAHRKRSNWKPDEHFDIEFVEKSST